MAQARGEGWYPDPDGIHQLRFHDGNEWTVHVANNGTMTQAPRPAAYGAGGTAGAGAAGAEVPGQAGASADAEWATHLAQEYGWACTAVLDAAQAALTVANAATGAWNMARKRPQHEISIQNFTSFARGKDAEFAPLFARFQGAVDAARAAGTKLMSQFGDPAQAEVCLILAVGDQGYSEIGAAIEFLRVRFPADAQGFHDLIPQVNHAIATTPGFGQPGFEGSIYADGGSAGVNQV